MSADANRPLVTLDVFSGRPNPSWELEGNTLSEVTARVRDLAGGSSAAAAQPVLGYRGFRIENLGPDYPDAIVVGRGVATIVRGKEAEHRTDSVGLERLLLEDAAQHGHSELLRAAGAPSPRDAE